MPTGLGSRPTFSCSHPTRVQGSRATPERTCRIQQSTGEILKFEANLALQLRYVRPSYRLLLTASTCRVRRPQSHDRRRVRPSNPLPSGFVIDDGLPALSA